MEDATTVADEAAETEATTTVESEAPEVPVPDPEGAAQQALARAAQPPASLGGQADDDADLERERALAEEGFGSRYAQTLAAQRHNGDDVTVEDDEYDESRSRVAAGQGDEVDLEAVTEWLLSDEVEVNTRLLRVRVGGTDDKPLVIPWYIRAIGIDVIRSAEREAAGNRSQRRGGGGYDELKANLRVVAEGTAAIGAPDGPDCKKVANDKGLRDPTTWLQRKFSYRPGAIAQIAGEVMALSGFDQEDVRAAGNS